LAKYILAFFSQNAAILFEKNDHGNSFSRKTPIFRRKLAKSPKNGDHNIDPDRLDL
jgi:hypothetical protein